MTLSPVSPLIYLISISASTAPSFPIFHSTFILPLFSCATLSSHTLSFKLCFLALFSRPFPPSYDDIFACPRSNLCGILFLRLFGFLLCTLNSLHRSPLFHLLMLLSSFFSSPLTTVPIQAGVITGAIIGVVLGLLVLIVVIYYLMRFLVARRVFSLSVRSVTGLWPAALCQSSLCQGLELRPEPIPGTDTCVAKLA